MARFFHNSVEMGIDSKIFGKDFELYKKALDVFFQRDLIISSNIANVDTPKYKAKDIYFEDYLRSIVYGEKPSLKLVLTNLRHIQSPYPPPPKPQVYYETNSFGPDGNSVDIDAEMIKLQENTFRYRVASEFMSGEFTSVRNALERMRI